MWLSKIPFAASFMFDRFQNAVFIEDLIEWLSNSLNWLGWLCFYEFDSGEFGNNTLVAFSFPGIGGLISVENIVGQKNARVLRRFGT